MKEKERKMPLKYKVLAAVCWILGLTTVMPAPASKPCLLGYYAHCSFTPVSTVILVVLGIVFLAIGSRKKKRQEY